MTDLIWDMAHPVGSVMQVANGFDPNTVRGAWERIEGRFLLASSGSYPRGSEGGEAAHALTVEELAEHGHIQNLYSTDGGGSETIPKWTMYIGDRWAATGAVRAAGPNEISGALNGATSFGRTADTGGSKPHNNMPPYMAVDTWRRVA